MKPLYRRLFWLRPEEAIALLFVLPTTYLTFAANAYARRVGLLGARYPGGVVRLAVALAFLTLLAVGLRLWPRSRALRGLREVLPFLVCILIYTNLHDTIGFVNPHDIHDTLIRLDQLLFGVQPCVWTERFVTRERTELMSLFYLNFFWIAPSTALLLLIQKRWVPFRRTLMSILVCFYLGYALYVLFPAAPPRLVLSSRFSQTLQGYPNLMAHASARAIGLLPADSRAAFPSLHAAVSLVALIQAWRYARRWFWLLLPFAIGLWISTIYLRHHFVVDLLAGWLLAPIAVALGPRLDAWWTRRQLELGYAPARGADL